MVAHAIPPRGPNWTYLRASRKEGSSDVSVGRMTRTEVGWDRPREVLRDSTHGMNARGLSVNERSDVLASVFSRRLGVPGCTSGAEQLRAGGQGGPPLAVPCPARQPAGRRHLMRGDREPVREGQPACEVAIRALVLAGKAER